MSTPNRSTTKERADKTASANRRYKRGWCKLLAEIVACETLRTQLLRVEEDELRDQAKTKATFVAFMQRENSDFVKYNLYREYTNLYDTIKERRPAEFGNLDANNSVVVAETLEKFGFTGVSETTKALRTPEEVAEAEATTLANRQAKAIVKSRKESLRNKIASEQLAARNDPDEQPAEQQPEEPVEQQPEEPAEQQPEEPAEQQPEEPAEQQPEEPAEQQPEEPVEQQPEEPVEQQPEEPAEQQPEEPAEQQPEEPAEQQPEEPAEQQPEEPVEQQPEEPVEQQPEEPAEKKKRGRPKKQPKEIVCVNQDVDIIAEITKNAEYESDVEVDDGTGEVSALSAVSTQGVASKKVVTPQKNETLDTLQYENTLLRSRVEQLELFICNMGEIPPSHLMSEAAQLNVGAESSKPDDCDVENKESEDEESEDEESEDEESEDEDETSVTLFVHDGIKYYRDGDNHLYAYGNLDDPEIIGRWNHKKKCVEEIEEED